MSKKLITMKYIRNLKIITRFTPIFIVPMRLISLLKYKVVRQIFILKLKIKIANILNLETYSTKINDNIDLSKPLMLNRKYIFSYI